MLIWTTVLTLCFATVPVVMMFHRVLLSVNLVSAYVCFTIIFSGIGVYLYSFTDVFLYQYDYLRLDFLGEKDYAHAIVIVHGGLLLVLLGYAIPARLTPAFVERPGLFLPPASMRVNPARFGVKLVLVLVLVLAALYLLKHRSTLVSGGLGTILGSLTSHTTQIELRYEISGDFFFFVFTTCVLTYVTAYFTVLRNHAEGPLKYAWILLLVLAVYLHLGTFQKRPLIVFLITVVYVFAVTKPGASFSAGRLIRISLIAGLIGFGTLFTLYSIIFAGIGSGFTAGQVLFVSVMQVLVRLANSVLMTAHVYPEYEPYFGLTNVRVLAVLFDFDYYVKDVVMFDIFKTSEVDGSTASSALVDFYGGFGWGGLLFLAPLLGFFLYLVEVYIRAQPHNLDRFIFSIFTVWFVYYLTQANFFRAAHGYGFFYFVVVRYLFLLAIPRDLPAMPRPRTAARSTVEMDPQS